MSTTFTSRPVRLGLIQMSMHSDPQKNLDRAVNAMEEAVRRGAQVICLPELFRTPYFPIVEKDTAAFSEPLPGPVTETLCEFAKLHGVVVVGGSVYEQAAGQRYNTSPVIDADGTLLGYYRKMHIPHDPCFFEQNYFAPGDLGYRVFDTRFGKIAVLICYDQWFPEAARIASLQGAQIIFYPTAIGTVEGIAQSEGNWQEAWENVQRGHAIANNVIVAAVNRVGREGSSLFWGGSFVCDAFGKTLVRGGDQEDVLLTEVDLAHNELVREGWRFFYNRRVDSYGDIEQAAIEETPQLPPISSHSCIKC